MLARVLAVVVCLCVCLSHAGIVSKRLNVGSRKQRHVIAQGLEFSDARSRWWGTPTWKWRPRWRLGAERRKRSVLAANYKRRCTETAVLIEIHFE